MSDVVQRMDAMVDRLTKAGWLTHDDVRTALYDVPRHEFVPRVAWTGDGDRVDRDTDPDGWLELAYGTDAIITQLDDGATDVAAGEGAFTSSCSASSTVVSLLELLDTEPGHRVLEIGTGTGWTAALLSHMVGEGNVTSVEVDPSVCAVATENLKGAGFAPRLVLGDGAAGWPPGVLYDRVHATCAVAQVPYAWIEQTRPGGAIVTPFSPGFGTSHELRLVVLPDGTAVGRFPGYASYMMMRSQRRPSWEPSKLEASHSTTNVDPRTIGHAPAGADLAMAAALPGVQAQGHRDGDRYVLRLWEPNAWATATFKPGRDSYDVQQAGNRLLWEEAEAAYFRWVSWSEPGRDRFGMTVTPDAQHIWLDHPDRVVGGME